MYEYKTKDLEELETHELANLTPTMTAVSFETLKLSIANNGQQMPIVLYKGKIIDGRHRVKALRELGLTTVNYIDEDPNKTEEDLRVLILEVLENRRHQTTTQKAIMAYYEFVRLLDIGEKKSQGKVAGMFGSTRLQLSRVITLAKLADNRVIDHLFHGDKINIGTKMQPSNTDSLASIVSYFEKNIGDTLENSLSSGVKADLTDSEIKLVKEAMSSVKALMSKRVAKVFNEKLYHYIKETGE